MGKEQDGIAVFGSSESRPGEPGHEQALELGRLLASAGHRVVTGGYGGVMEAASRGAREGGGRTLGVACAVFDHRRPNRYLDEIITTPDLFVRTRELVNHARGFVVLPGKAGTLAELAFLWALHRAGCLERRPMVLLGTSWNELLRQLHACGFLDVAQRAICRVADSPREAVTLIEELLPRA